ncbi:MAG: carbon-nitrogen hydrolase family protein [Bradymonadia bacterium]
MNVAAVQSKAVKGQKAETLHRLVHLSERAAHGRALDLLVLPEMAATGYIFPTAEAVRRVAESPTGETFQALAPVAQSFRTWLVVGFAEAADDQLFNSALVINPAGELAFTYRKTLLFEADEHWAAPGDSGYRTFDTDNGDFGVGICMDLNDDAFVQWCREAAPRAIAFPTNWLDQGVPVWPYWAWRLGGVPSALVAANTYGREHTTHFAGSSAILDQGVLLAYAPPSGDGVLASSLDPC